MTDLAAAVDRLAAGSLVAFPTETVYGLGADALSASAVRNVFQIKGRPATNPLIVHLADTAMARQVVADWPEEAERLARAFWPGPLTLVLPRRPELPAEVTAGGELVAVRCPDHPLTLELLRRFGRPLVGPSANRSGQVSPTTAAHVDFPPDQVLVLDGGPCRGGIESTVLALNPPRILRPGLITSRQLAQVLGREVQQASAPQSASPGQLERHYAPHTPAVLVQAEDWPAVRAGARRIALLASQELEPSAEVFLPMPADPRGYAERLYAGLREADDAGVELIAVLAPQGEDELWTAVRDRLRRATVRFEKP